MGVVAPAAFHIPWPWLRLSPSIPPSRHPLRRRVSTYLIWSGIVIFWRLRAPPFFEFGLIPVPMLDRCVEDSIQKSTPPAATSKHAWPTTDRQNNKLSLFTNWSVRLMRYKIQWDMEFVCPTDRQTNCAVYIVSSTKDRRI